MVNQETFGCGSSMLIRAALMECIRVFVVGKNLLVWALVSQKQINILDPSYYYTRNTLERKRRSVEGIEKTTIRVRPYLKSEQSDC